MQISLRETNKYLSANQAFYGTDFLQIVTIF